VAFFAEDLTRHKPPPAKNTFALQRFRQLIQQMPDQEFLKHTPDQIAELCGCSRRHLGRLFRSHFGVALRTKQTELRLLLACQLLMDTNVKIIQVAMESGYRSLGLFNTMFKRAFGMTPSEWRQKYLKKPRGPKLRRAAAMVLLLSWPLAQVASAAGLDQPKVSSAAPTAASVATGDNGGGATNKAPTFEVKAYEIRGNTLLPYTVMQGIFTTNFTGPAITFETIRSLLGNFQMAYRDRGFVTVSVGLPPQTLTNGLVKVQVTEGRLAEINVVNNHYFSSNNVVAALPCLLTNTVLNSLVFQQELDRANNNRDRQIYPVIGPGPDPGTSSLTLKVKERLPLHGRFELNNFSTPATPELRMNLASQYNNLWQLNHQFGLQYSFTPEDLKEGSHPIYDRPLVANYSAFYRMPLSGANGPPRRSPYDLSQFGYDEVTKRFRPPPASDVGELLFYVSRSASDTGSQLQSETLTPAIIPPEGALQVSDRLFNRTLTINEGLGARLLQPLPGIGPVHSSFSLGPDFKKFHADSAQDRTFQATIFVPEFGSVGPPFDTFPSPPTRQSRAVANSVKYLPISLSWDASLSDKYGATYFNVNNSFNWNGVFDNANDFRIAAGSQQANGTYYVGQLGFTRDQKLPYDWTLHLHADGQWTTQPLISNEQFGSGGNAGVRGYRDGAVYTDTGWRVLFEPRTPNWNLGKVDGTAPMYVRLSAFVDYGQGYLLDPGPRKRTTSMLGAGLGLSGSIGEHVDFRFTLGFPLLDVPGTSAGDPRVTFSLGGQF
jgi:hemolysin activation/secretion protein/AraC-like DNA-binding protein